VGKPALKSADAQRRKAFTLRLSAQAVGPSPRRGRRGSTRIGQSPAKPVRRGCAVLVVEKLCRQRDADIALHLNHQP
jgi:hypothetical protein